MAAPGFTVTIALDATGASEMLAPRVTDPAFSAVKVDVKVPEPAAAGDREPVPPTKLELNTIEPAPGKPLGF